MTVPKNQKLSIGLALAMTLSIATWVSPEKASAQSVLDIIKPLSGLFKKDPVPVPNLNSNFGTNNMNSNTMNVCLFPCAPTGNPAAANSSNLRIPQGSVAPMQGNTAASTSCVNGRCQTVASPNMIPQQQQQRPSGPVLTLPPIPIPINLGL